VEVVCHVKAELAGFESLNKEGARFWLHSPLL
jgi:hypothetical protein